MTETSTPLANATESDRVTKCGDMASHSRSGAADDAIVIDVHMAIGLRPDPDLAGHRLGELVGEIELAVEITLHAVALDHDLEVMPGLRRRGHVTHPLHRAAPALFELPQHEIVLERVGAHREIVAIGPQIEEDPGTLIDAARQRLKS